MVYVPEDLKMLKDKKGLSRVLAGPSGGLVDPTDVVSAMDFSFCQTQDAKKLEIFRLPKSAPRRFSPLKSRFLSMPKAYSEPGPGGSTPEGPAPEPTLMAQPIEFPRPGSDDENTNSHGG